MTLQKKKNGLGNIVTHQVKKYGLKYDPMNKNTKISVKLALQSTRQRKLKLILMSIQVYLNRIDSKIFIMFVAK